MKRILLILITLFIFVGCEKKVEPVQPQTNDDGVIIDGSYYVEQLKNYEIKDKNPNNTNDNEEFKKFMDDVFEEMVKSTYLDFHYYLYDYKALNFEKPEVTLGEVTYGFDNEEFMYYYDLLEDLRTYDYDSLSYTQQYDFDAIEYYCIEEMAGLCFYKYNFILSTGSNILEDHITYFTDFTFYDEESINDYLTCLTDLERFTDEVLQYTEDQAKGGYPMIDEWINYTKDVCDGLTSKVDDNNLIVTFDTRIDDLSFIDEKTKQDYKNKDAQIIKDIVIPAFNKVSKTIEKYYGKKKLEDYALYKLDESYAEYVYMSSTSTNSSMDDIFQTLCDGLNSIEAQYYTSYNDKASWEMALQALNGHNENLNLQDYECIDFLIENVDKYFPKLEETEYSIDFLDPTVAPAGAIAYYWPHPVDNNNQNIIRVNPDSFGVSCDAFNTIAHESVPGHLYQKVYYGQNSDNYLRQLIGFSGYDEGWAVYSTYYAFMMAGITDENAVGVLFDETNDYFYTYSIIDLLTNYYGYSTQEIYDAFSEISIFEINKDSLDFYRKYMIESPGIYTRYGYGSAYLLNLRDEVKNKLKDNFDISEFHKSILINGAMPYNILKDYVDNNFNLN